MLALAGVDAAGLLAVLLVFAGVDDAAGLLAVLLVFADVDVAAGLLAELFAVLFVLF